MAAFEQSLGNMTIRLQSLTMTAEQKASIRSIWEIFISVSSVVAHAPFVVVGGGGESHMQFALAPSFVVTE